MKNENQIISIEREEGSFTLSPHAYVRFEERLEKLKKLKKDLEIKSNLKIELKEMFKEADYISRNKVKKNKKFWKLNKKSTGKFYQYDDIIFIVKNKVIVTITLADQYACYNLNNVRLAA